MAERSSALYSKLIRLFLGFTLWLICFLFSLELILRLAGFFYLRLPSLAENIAKSDVNIICVGDSFTYGLGVKREGAYPKQLEKLLNEAPPVNRHFKVFNLGVPGSNSSQHLKYLKEILNENKNIDLAIILTEANDRWNFADSNIYKFQPQKGLAQIASIRLQILFSNLRVYKMVKIILLNTKGMPPEARMSYLKQVARTESADARSLRELLEYNITEMIKLAQASGIKIMFQSYPHAELRAVEQVASRYRVPFVNHAELFSQNLRELERSDLFLYDNSHPNERGYGIMARALYDAIVSENIFGDK